MKRHIGISVFVLILGCIALSTLFQLGSPKNEYGYVEKISYYATQFLKVFTWIVLAAAYMLTKRIQTRVTFLGRFFERMYLTLAVFLALTLPIGLVMNYITSLLGCSPVSFGLLCDKMIPGLFETTGTFYSLLAFPGVLASMVIFVIHIFITRKKSATAPSKISVK